MKTIAIVAMLIYSLNGIAQTPARIVSNKVAEISFDHDMHDFGTVNYDKPAEHEFIFTNTGKTPLMIKDIKAECACITPTWSKTPVPPGKTGSILIAYDTKQVGVGDNIVTITSNAKSPVKELTIKINVLPGETPKTPDNLAAPTPPGNIFDE